MSIFVDFKNRGEAEVFKHEDIYSIFFTIGFVTWPPFLYQDYYKGGQVTKPIVKNML